MVKYGDLSRITRVEVSDLARGILALSNEKEALDKKSQELADTQLKIMEDAFNKCKNISQQQRAILLERQKIEDIINSLLNEKIMVTYGV
jgi:Ni,Fe-hydrogenase I large subunit